MSGLAESGREAASPEPAAMAGALERLTEVPALQTQSAAERPSTITVKPTLTWPSLGDNDFDVDAFFEEFEKKCGLANNGRGMAPIEMVRTLGNCVKGSRKQAYKVELRAAR